jgi:hypothetical protein
MNRLPSLALCVVGIALIFGFAVNRTQAQAAPPAAPPQEQAQKPATRRPKDSEKDAEDEEENPFAPEPAPTLPPGMTGSDANDPRAKLAPGLYNAGETSMGIEHLLLLKKPDAFQLGATDPDDPKVETMVGQLGMGNNKKIPKASALADRATCFCQLGPCLPRQPPVPGKFLWHEHLRHLQSGEHEIADVDGLPGRTG